MGENSGKRNRFCANCVYVYQEDVDPKNLSAPRVLSCRRNPPAVLLLAGDRVATMWPPVQPTSFCGEQVTADLYELRLKGR